VLIHPEDAAELGVREGDAILLRSDVGAWEGVACPAPVKRRHVQTYWPETNVLIPRRCDPVSGAPDYNVLVTIEPVRALPGMHPAPVVEPGEPAPVREPAPAMVRTRTDQA
jgi:predicted molibdopterin-dependent oxidoreductase YjgC